MPVACFNDVPRRCPVTRIITNENWIPCDAPRWHVIVVPYVHGDLSATVIGLKKTVRYITDVSSLQTFVRHETNVFLDFFAVSTPRKSGVGRLLVYTENLIVFAIISRTKTLVTRRLPVILIYDQVHHSCFVENIRKTCT